MSLLNLEDRTASQGLPFLELGFRPFFAGAPLFGLFAILGWMLLYLGWLDGGWLTVPSMLWHGHEMIYGYGMGVIAGFLLTAVHNWTGQETISGRPLLALFALWAGARLGFLLPIPLVVTAALDTAFLIWTCIEVTRPVVRIHQWKQIGVLAKLYLFVPANLLFYLGAMGLLAGGERLGLYAGLYLVIAMIFNMGRRVIPFFIEKGVGYPVQIRNRPWVDVSNLVLFLFFALADLTGYGDVAAFFALALLPVNAVRMWDWHTPGIWRRPLLWVLYVGYGWIVLGFVLYLAARGLGLSPFLVLHAFTVGGIGTITLGMMARVTLGHTGRSVFSPPAGLNWLFGLMTAAALLRVFGPLAGGPYTLWIVASQLLWAAALGGFLYVYLPTLWGPTVKGWPR